jgi:hypothetical protein
MRETQNARAVKARNTADGGEAPARRDFDFAPRFLPLKSPPPRDGFGRDRVDASASLATTVTPLVFGDDRRLSPASLDDDAPFWTRLFRAS